jgi:SOS-response transcriptional repressor LexA
VDANQPGDVAALSAAIQAAKPGDLILVRRVPYEDGRVMDEPLEIPVVGEAASSSPAVMTAEGIKSLLLPLDNARRDHVFAAKVQGDSMTADGLLDGDYVIVDNHQQPEDGDTVVVVIGNPNDSQAMVRRLRLRPDGTPLLLESSQPDVPPIPFTPQDDLLIQGVVIGVFRPSNKIEDTGHSIC